MATLAKFTDGDVIVVTSEKGYEQIAKRHCHVRALELDNVTTDKAWAAANELYPSPAMATFVLRANDVERDHGHHVGTWYLLEHLVAVGGHTLCNASMPVPNTHEGRWDFAHVTDGELCEIFGHEGVIEIAKWHLNQLTEDISRPYNVL